MGCPVTSDSDFDRSNNSNLSQRGMLFNYRFREKTMKRLFDIGILALLVSLPGCAGWGPGGNECFVGPLAGMRQGICTTCNDHCVGDCQPFANLRRALTCGPGCGEVYYGEWLNSPPDGNNPGDTRGYVPWIPRWLPWMGRPWSPCGIKYRQNGMGYGNPALPAHRGWADYGGYWNRIGYPEGCSKSPCNGDCGKPGCAPNAPPSTGKLKPIPKPRPKTAETQVSYVSPLVKARYAQRRKGSGQRDQ